MTDSIQKPPQEEAARDENPGDLTHLVPLSMWRELNSPTLFPTTRTWEFFKSAHKVELVDKGALILGSGSRGDYVNLKLIAAVVSEILLRESRARLQQGAKR